MDLNPNYILMAVFLLHMLCVAWAGQGLMPLVFFFVHGFALLSGLAAIIKPSSHESILMFLLVTLLSIPVDIILLLIYKSRYIDNNYSTDTSKEAKFSLAFSIINLVGEPFMLFLLYCLWRFRLGEPFVLGVGEYGIKLAEGGSYGAGNAQQGTANPFGPGYNSNYAPTENTAPVVSTSSARPGASAYPSVPSKGVEAGYQQPYGAGAPSVMDGTYSTHN